VVVVLVALGEGEAALLLGDGRELVFRIERLCGLSAAAAAATSTTAAAAASAAPASTTAGALVIAGRFRREQRVAGTGALVRVVLADFNRTGALVALNV
jgi:hypothetical protein